MVGDAFATGTQECTPIFGTIFSQRSQKRVAFIHPSRA
jgi:hypothetical protein